MLNREEFASLNVGDMVETDSLLHAVFPDEPTVFLCVDSGEDFRKFEIMYFNVHLGTATCKREPEGFRWRFEINE